MNTRLGMTLIEVLAATVLLALVVGVSVSTLQSVSADIESVDQTIARAELQTIADRVVADPEAYGLSFTHMVEESDLGERLIRVDAGGPLLASVRLLRPDDQDADHTWLEIRVQESSVYRWVPLPRTEERNP